MSILLAFGLSLGFSLVIMPFVLAVAKRNGWYDRVDERKIHTASIPRLGGIGIFYAFALALLISTLASTRAGRAEGFPAYWVVILASLGIHVVGLLDDFYDLRARYKFAIQSLAALVVIGFGFRFRIVLVPFGDGVLELGSFSYVLTYLWIVGMTNAMNLVDGMDGLAGGIAAIAAGTFGLFFLAKGNHLSASIAFALVGGIGGFLWYNRPPARIFMGDSGSLFLGFILSVLPLLGPAEGVVEVGLISSITVLLVPIGDTLTAILRRAIAGKSFFEADKRHLHHKLLRLGLSVPSVLLLLYGICLALGFCALTTLFLEPTVSFWIKLGSWCSLTAFFVVLHFRTKDLG